MSDEYLAIARRFRPKLFKEVTGQKAIVAVLKNALLQNRASHAYLFSGMRGTGKTTLARIFARALNCTSLSKEGEPCNECRCCRDMAEGKSFDFIEIDGASNRGIDDIRNLNESITYTTFSSRFKIYLIDEVHMLTKEAFNALLKSLEEPPPKVKFFLATTEVHKVLPTIVSRCQTFDLSRISDEAIIERLERITKEIGVGVEKDALLYIARLSEGSLRDAESMVDQLICMNTVPIKVSSLIDNFGLIDKEEFFALDSAFKNRDLSFAFHFAHKMFALGKDMTHFLEGLLEHYRTLAMMHFHQKETVSLTERENRGYQKSLTVYQPFHLLHILDYLSTLIHQPVRPIYKKVHVETILLHVLQTKDRISLQHLMERLTALQQTKVCEQTKQEKEKPVVNHSTRYDTLLQFAQVELQGVLKKNVL